MGDTSRVMKLSKFLEKQCSKDEDYKGMISYLQTLDGRSAPSKMKSHKYRGNMREKDDGYALVLRHLKEDGNLCRQKEKCKKRKRKGKIREQVDDSDVELIDKSEFEKSCLNKKSGPRSSRAKEWPREHANRVQSRGGTKKVQGQRCLQQLSRGKKAVGEDGAAKRKPDYKIKEERGGKFKVVVKKEVKNEKERIYQKELKNVVSSMKAGLGSCAVKKEHGSRNQAQLGKELAVCGQKESKNAVSSMKAGLGSCVVKKEPDQCVETGKHIKGINRRVKFAETIAAEVEILDHDMVVKRRISTPFVSCELHCNMPGEETPRHGIRTASHVFRKEILQAMRKPYDKEEYKNCQDTIQAGSYLKLEPDLRAILAKFRYQKAKRLVIIRGYLFWLQNLTREGAFCPWEDEECLAVEIPYP